MQNLIVRIQKAELNNFRNVEHGKFNFACNLKKIYLKMDQIYWVFMVKMVLGRLHLSMPLPCWRHCCLENDCQEIL